MNFGNAWKNREWLLSKCQAAAEMIFVKTYRRIPRRILVRLVNRVTKDGEIAAFWGRL
jgi:hypothetical protein